LEVTHLWAWPYQTIHHIAEVAADAVPAAPGFVQWAVTAALDAIVGLFLGLLLIPLATRVIGPAIAAVFPKQKASH
jgi:hypothetical protein